MLPRAIIHNAVSADGRIDWIQPDIGLYYRLTEVWEEDATMAGSATILSLAGRVPEGAAMPPAEAGASPAEPAAEGWGETVDDGDKGQGEGGPELRS